MIKSNKKRAFVTGGNGFLGLNVIDQLSAAGWKIISFDKSDSNKRCLDGLDVQFILGDITDPISCESALPDKTDAIFHLAGNTSHWSLRDNLQTLVNVQGVQNMVSPALKRKAKRFIHTSSIAAYGFQPEIITERTESAALNSHINYFRTKRLGELEVLKGIEKGLNAMIINPSNIIGPFDFGGWSRLFHLINNGKLRGAPPGKASFCHVREVAKAHISAFEKGICGHNYLLGGADATWLEFVQIIGKLLGRKTPHFAAPAFFIKTIGRASLWYSYFSRKDPDVTPEKAELVTSELICKSDKAVKALGYKIIPLKTMLTDCHRWLINEGLLKCALYI